MKYRVDERIDSKINIIAVSRLNVKEENIKSTNQRGDKNNENKNKGER